MNPPCARCKKTVYPTEKLVCLDKVSELSAVFTAGTSAASLVKMLCTYSSAIHSSHWHDHEWACSLERTYRKDHFTPKHSCDLHSWEKIQALDVCLMRFLKRRAIPAYNLTPKCIRKSTYHLLRTASYLQPYTVRLRYECTSRAELSWTTTIFAPFFITLPVELETNKLKLPFFVVPRCL